MTLVIAWRTTKLIEGGQTGHRGLQAYRPICYYFYVFTFFTFFFKIQKTWLFTVFCSVSYVFSNYASANDMKMTRMLTGVMESGWFDINEIDTAGEEE